MEKESQSDEPMEQDNSYPLFTLQSSDQNPITVQVELNKLPSEMELDTGVSFSFISKSTYDSIANQIPLQKSNVKLTTYTDEPVGILGATKVKVKYRIYSICGAYSNSSPVCYY